MTLSEAVHDKDILGMTHILHQHYPTKDNKKMQMMKDATEQALRQIIASKVLDYTIILLLVQKGGYVTDSSIIGEVFNKLMHIGGLPYCKKFIRKICSSIKTPQVRYCWTGSMLNYAVNADFGSLDIRYQISKALLIAGSDPSTIYQPLFNNNIAESANLPAALMSLFLRNIPDASKSYMVASDVYCNIRKLLSLFILKTNNQSGNELRSILKAPKVAQSPKHEVAARYIHAFIVLLFTVGYKFDFNLNFLKESCPEAHQTLIGLTSSPCSLVELTRRIIVKHLKGPNILYGLNNFPVHYPQFMINILTLENKVEVQYLENLDESEYPVDM